MSFQQKRGLSGAYRLLVYKLKEYRHELGLDGIDLSDSWELVKILNVI